MATDIHAHVIDNNNAELTEYISVAADAAFGEQAQSAISTIINGLAGEEIAECTPVNSIKIIHQLHEVAVGKDDTASATGAAALLSTIALGYQPMSDPKTAWQRRGSALSAVAREVIEQIQPEHRFTALFAAVGRACVEGSIQYTNDAAALHLVDVHDTLTTPEAALEPQAESPQITEEPTQAAFLTIQTSTEATQPREDDSPRHQLSFTASRYDELESPGTITDAIKEIPWLRNRVPENFSPDMHDLKEDGRTIAKVINFIPVHPTVAKICERSRIGKEKLDELLAPAISQFVKQTASASLKTKNFGGTPLTYLRKNGASERVYRVYFKQVGEESDKTPVIGLLGASRTKALQARMLTVFTGKRIQSRKLKA